jgi:hypothetical protein
MPRWIIAGIGALLLVVLYFLWSGTGRQTQSTGEMVMKTEIKPSAPAEEESSPPVPKRDTPSVASARTAVDQDQPGDSQSEQTDKSLEALRPKADGPVDVLKRVYRTESRDETSQDTERLIREEFGPEYLPIDALQNVICHKSVCKIEMYWSEQNPTVVMALAMKIGPLLTGHMAFDPAPEPDDRGRLLVDIYVVRPGYDVANME